MLSPGKTRSRLSYDHSRISRRDSILLLSCFETRSRLQKIISCGRARKNQADSRREFPGSRILADLCYSPSTNQNMRIYSSSCCFSRSMCICQTGLRVCGGSSFKSLPRASLYNVIPSFWPSIVNCSHVDVAIQGKAWKLAEKIRSGSF